MKYKVEYSKRFQKDLNKFDRYTKKLLIGWINTHLADADNPFLYGKELKGNLKGKWRYRVGDYRIIAEIQNDNMIILLVNIGHRRNVYIVHEDEEDYEMY